MASLLPEPIPTRGRVDSEVGVSDTGDHNSYKSTSGGGFPPSPLASLRKSSSHVQISDLASDEQNPQPQISQAPTPTQSGTNGDKLVIVMVGLPARGKTFIARKIAHYFTFFHGAPAEVYNVGNYRREISGAEQSADFFDSKNKSASEARQQAAEQAMTALKKFMREGTEVGRVGVFDATNTTKIRRNWIMKELEGKVFFKFFCWLWC